MSIGLRIRGCRFDSCRGIVEEPFVFDSGDEQKQEAKKLLEQWIDEGRMQEDGCEAPGGAT